MAVESLTYRIFSTESDVWSYGIVLWELFSLARTPYPAIEPDEGFQKRLESGYRMEKPDYAPDEMYSDTINNETVKHTFNFANPFQI